MSFINLGGHTHLFFIVSVLPKALMIRFQPQTLSSMDTQWQHTVNLGDLDPKNTMAKTFQGSLSLPARLAGSPLSRLVMAGVKVAFEKE